jgi:hypothetical protein
MADESLRIVIDALNKSSDEIKKVKKDIDGLEEATKTADKSSKNFGETWAGVLTGLNAGIQIAQQVAAAMKQVYETAREGAELEMMQTRFDNLSRSIGTTADALLGDLREATRGLVSDSELMASAADFMGLGLAKTHDEAVRLASVAGALNMNMNQLVLTLTNQTTMRFDALGVSVDGFDKKVKDLKATGMDTNKAFTEAFLAQAEEQIDKVGPAADSAFGDFQRLESGVKNLSDAIKKDLAEEAIPIIKMFADELTVINANKAIEDMEKQLRSLGYTAADIEGLWKGKTFFLFDEAGAADAALKYVQILTNELNKVETAAEYSGKALTDPQTFGGMPVIVGGINQRLYETNDILEDLTESTFDFAKELEAVTGLDKNFNGNISMAKNYDETLEDIDEKQVRIQELLSLDGKGGYLNGVWISAKDAKNEIQNLNGEILGLKDDMASVANQMTLDMYKATLAIGGFTDNEIQAYFTMAAEMGVISEEAADKAYADYIGAKNRIESDPIIVSVDGGEMEEISAIINGIPTKINVSVIADYYENIYGNTYKMPGGIPGGKEIPIEKPIGGPVSAGNPYLWQEYGYRGEVMVPSQNGYVLSRADAERILSASAGGGGAVYAGPSADDIARAVRDAILTAGIL